jgi:tetratricopeptide (TPR) repeat protein
MEKIGRNEPCPCGSGKKYKRCCLANDLETERLALATAPATDLPSIHHSHVCEECDAKIDAAANTVIFLIDEGKIDLAEQVAQALVEFWPDGHDGYDCLAMVYQARGDMQRAAEYYRKVVTFVRKDPGLYDPDFEDYYNELIERLDPAIQGAPPPNPRDI